MKLLLLNIVKAYSNNNLDFFPEVYVCLWAECTYLTGGANEIQRHVTYHSYHTRLKNIGGKVSEEWKLPVSWNLFSNDCEAYSVFQDKCKKLRIWCLESNKKKRAIKVGPKIVVLVIQKKKRVYLRRSMVFLCPIYWFFWCKTH